MSESAPWGASQSMSEVDAATWRAEVDPALRSDSVVIEVLGEAPEREWLVAAHEWGLRLVRRFRQRVVEDPLRIGPPGSAIMAMLVSHGDQCCLGLVTDNAAIPPDVFLTCIEHGVADVVAA